MKIELVKEQIPIPQMGLPRKKDRHIRIKEEKAVIRAFNNLEAGQSFIAHDADYDTLSGHLSTASKVTGKPYTLRDVRGRTQVWILKEQVS